MKYYSRCDYYSRAFVERFLFQKNRIFTKVLLSVHFEVAANTTLQSEELVLSTITALECLSGQRPKLMSYTSRYVGSTKRAFFRVRVNLNQFFVLCFLDDISLCYMPGFQRRFGRTKLDPRSVYFVICCQDLHLFYGLPFTPMELNTNIFISNSGNFGMADFLQLLKFNCGL